MRLATQLLRVLQLLSLSFRDLSATFKGLQRRHKSNKRVKQLLTDLNRGESFSSEKKLSNWLLALFQELTEGPVRLCTHYLTTFVSELGRLEDRK